MVQRGHVTQLAAAWLSEQKQPGEELGLGVDQRPDSWRLVIRTGDVGVTASCGPDPEDDVIRAVLVSLLADARQQAALGAGVKARRYRQPEQ